MAFTHVPEQLGKALAKNEAAANAFAMLTPDQKKRVAAKASRTRTPLGMHRIISQLAKESHIE